MHLRGSPRIQSKQTEGSPKLETQKRSTIEQASKIASPKQPEPFVASFVNKQPAMNYSAPMTLTESNPEKYKIAISESQLKIKQLYTLSSISAIARVDHALNTSGNSLVSSAMRRGRRDRNDRKKSTRKLELESDNSSTIK